MEKENKSILLINNNQEKLNELSKNLNINVDILKNDILTLMNNNTLIELKNINAFYNKNKHVLHNVSFKILPGKFHIFIGDNGAGKSTTIKVIVKALSQYSGEIIYCKSLENSQGIKQVSYCPDKTIFPTSLNLYKYLYLLCMLTVRNHAEAKQKILKYLEKFDLLKFKNKNPNRLSSGQKRKIVLISVLLEDSKLIIVDEPMVNLDPSTKYKFFEELKIKQKEGKTIFISTHQIDEAQKYADYITFIKDGKIEFSGDFIEHKNNELYKKYFQVQE